MSGNPGVQGEQSNQEVGVPVGQTNSARTVDRGITIAPLPPAPSPAERERGVPAFMGDLLSQGTRCEASGALGYPLAPLTGLGSERRIRKGFFGGRVLAGVLLCILCGGLAARAQDSEDSLREQINAKLRAGQVNDAAEQARLAVGQYPQSSSLYQLLGVALFKENLNDPARNAFRRAIELDPSMPENYFDLAMVDLSEKRYSDAVSELETYLRLDPRNAQAHLLLGRAEHNLNQTGPAIEQFQRALELAPTLPLAHYHLGYAYQSQGNLQAALAEYRKEIANNPGFYESYTLAGNIELDQGDLARAEEDFRKAITLKPQAYAGHYGLGRVLLQKKQFGEAVSELQKAAGAAPNKVEVHYALARAYQQMGKKDEAQREFQICAQLNAASQKMRSGIAGAGVGP